MLKQENPDNPSNIQLQHVLSYLPSSSRPNTAQTQTSIKSTDSENTAIRKEVLRLYKEAQSAPRASITEKVSTPITQIDDGNTVSWEGDDDPQNPLNWPKRKKLLNLVAIFFIPFVSSVFAPAIYDMMPEFRQMDIYLAGFVISVSALGYALGPLIVGPLSELSGRVVCYHVCKLIFFTFTLACAASNSLETLAILRLFAGCGGSVVFTLSPATITDMIRPERHGDVMAIIGMGYNFGPAVSPIVGSYLNAAVGWRWIFKPTGIMGAVCVILSFLCLSETYEQVLLRRKVRPLKCTTGNQKLHSKFDNDFPWWKLFTKAMLRPLKMLFLSPNVFLVSLLTAVGYGYMYLLHSTFPSVFMLLYHWPTKRFGLAYLGTAVSDFIVKRRAAKGDIKPENRLILMVFIWPCVPAGLFLYGWSAQERLRVMVPLFGIAIFGFGSMSAILFSSTYIVDAYKTHAASATAASSVLRSILGGLLPLFAYKVYSDIKFGQANLLLGGIALALSPVPWLFYKCGEWFRERFRVNL
ncbi:MFS general substrate transporter [Lindgomyces ingoldianus]|uniref:MFS general substrate transporter n=1 Tax=Lindgomyces ingoldianus TaxID=673940 RepID=A0ACB6R3F6_9PLEO|nr:MFS general substrate transporter [Lindgomyces ingoldianus]KAF2473363.1 MFS general substrate transporter [Lindgomyces ingoldianus]